MRYIYTLFLSLIGCSSFAQVHLVPDIAMPIVKDQKAVTVCGVNLPDLSGTFKRPTPQQPDRIILCCRATIRADSDPLYVVDGIPGDCTAFSTLDPSTIERIYILKDAAATAIYGCRGVCGVIIIITKTFQKKIIVKDALSGETLAGATITYQKGKNTFAGITNDTGELIIDKFRTNDEFDMNITMTGYIGFSTTVINKSNEQTILLMRDAKICPEVIVGGSVCLKKVSSCGYIINRFRLIADTGVDRSKSTVLKVFPNPVSAGSDISISIKDNSPALVTVKVFGMSGQLLLTRPIAAADQKEQLTIHTAGNWKAGMYIVQLSDKNGHALQSSKLIIQ